jgi:hypothetical protein
MVFRNNDLRGKEKRFVFFVWRAIWFVLEKIFFFCFFYLEIEETGFQIINLKK